MPAPLGSGAGAFLAGEGTAGHDPFDASQARTRPPAVRALYFDPYDRVYAQNADLTMREGTGPVQRAAMLLLPLGALRSTPRSGLNVRAIRLATPERRQRAVEDELRVAWKVLLDSGQISIGRVVLDPSVPWNGRFDVDVTDLVSGRPATLGGRA